MSPMQKLDAKTDGATVNTVEENSQPDELKRLKSAMTCSSRNWPSSCQTRLPHSAQYFPSRSSAPSHTGHR